jgi:hypothetical protein
VDAVTGPLLVAAAIGGIVALTRFSLVLCAVPEEQELVAGIFITLAYGLLGFPLLAVLTR